LKPLSDKKLSKLTKDFVFARTKFAKGSDLAKKFKVESAPSLVLVDTLCDKGVKTVKLTVEDVEKALKAAKPSEIKWEKFGDEQHLKELAGKSKLFVIVFADDKEASKKVLSALASPMLSELIKQVVMIRGEGSPKKVFDATIDKVPAVVLVTNPFGYNQKTTVLDEFTTANVWKVLKDAVGKTPNGTDGDTEQIMLEVDGMS
jgi:hypothetical protein